MTYSTLNRSSIMELATYLMGEYSGCVKENATLRENIARLKKEPSANIPYIETIELAISIDPSVGDISVLKTSSSNDYSSAMFAVCFQDDNDVYIQYSGTPPGGWVENPISYSSHTKKVCAEDGISSQIQLDGLAFSMNV